MYKNSDIVAIENLHNKVFRLKGRMTEGCNYNCPYCIERLNRVNSFIPEDQIISMAKNINRLLKLNHKDRVHLSLLGGEVCYYNLINVINEIENVVSLTITTNFSRDNSFYKDLYLWCRERHIHIILLCSKHEENKDFNQKFLDLYNGAKENHLTLPRTAVVITKNRNTVDILNTFGDIPKSAIAIFLEKSVKDQSFNDTLKEDLQEHIKLMEQNNKPHYKITLKNEILEFNNIIHFISNLDNGGFTPTDMLCSAGVDNIIINWDGNIYRNQCFELNTKSLGTVEEDVIFPNDYYHCNNKDIRCAICNGVTLRREEK